MDPEERPGFSELCSLMEQFLSLVCDYSEFKMVLVEDNHGGYSESLCTTDIDMNALAGL